MRGGMMPPVLELVDLTAGYGDNPIVHEFSTRLAGGHHHDADRRQRRRQVDAAARDLRHQPLLLRRRSSSAGEPVERLHAVGAAEARHRLRAAGPLQLPRYDASPKT